MYYPFGWPKVLKIGSSHESEVSEVIVLQTNHDRNLLLILTASSIHVWNTRPTVEIVAHKRSPDSIIKVGKNLSAIWKPDSTVIVVLTDYNQLLFYQVNQRIVSTTAAILNKPMKNFYHDNINLFNIQATNRKTHRNHDEDFFHDICPDVVPALVLFLSGKLDLSYIGVSCILSAEEELIVASKNGDIYGILWNGSFDEKFPWSIIDGAKSNTYITDLKFSAVLGGFSSVFSSGEAGFIPLDSSIPSNDCNQTVSKIKLDIKYLSNIKTATSCEINHKYRMIAFGLEDSRIIVCNVGDSNTIIVENHSLQLPTEKYLHIQENLGSVTVIRYSTDNQVLINSWELGCFAIWSVFGSLLFFSGQWDHNYGSVSINSISWGIEGYNIFLSLKNTTSLTKSDNGNSNNIGMNNESSNLNSKQVIVISLARSALLLSPNNACLTDSILLISEDSLYIGSSLPHCQEFDNWQLINIPPKHLSSNFPIRYATSDRNCNNVVIAGNTGFAIVCLKTESWFICDRDDFSVTSDLIYFNQYLILACYNFNESIFELRAYKVEEGKFYSVVILTIPQEVISMSLFENRILVLYADGTMAMFMLNLRKTSNKLGRSQSSRTTDNLNLTTNSKQQNIPRKTSLFVSRPSCDSNSNLVPSDFCLQIAPIERLVVSNLLVNPYCITSITLTRLHFKNDRTDDSILLNACGKLFLLEREILSILPSTSSSPQANENGGDNIPCSAPNKENLELERKVNEAKVASNHAQFASASLKNNSVPTSVNSLVAFKSVTMIATNVEHYWISPDISNASELSYFNKTLWLYCGGLRRNLQVWFPLLDDKNRYESTIQYTPDRIMLPMYSDIYPIAIKSSASNKFDCSNDTIILGAENDVLNATAGQISVMPYYTIKRQYQIYLHRILLELLKRNLGYYAHKIAESCNKLPYFAHSFELLLHEVLEEEASSPHPIPDPMLPQVVEFIRQSPVYLETVVHCARKSDLSMWPHLFSVVGNPQRLFQECLDKGYLETAASCLMILQSFDRLTISKQMVEELINASKKDPKYHHLVGDLETFSLRAELETLTINKSKSNLINQP